MWIVSLFLIAHFLMTCFFPPHWLVWALNLLWILILWCIYVATIFHGLLTCPLSAHGVPRSPLMGNHRKFFSDFYSRRSWASSQKLVWGLSPLWIHVTDSLLLFWLQGNSGQTLLTSSNGPELPSRHPVTWSSSLSSHSFPLVQFHCPFLFLFSGFITSVSCLQPFFATMCGIHTWLYFLLGTAHFTEDEIEAPKGAVAWARAAISESTEKNRLTLILFMSVVLRPSLFPKRKLVWFAD